MSLYTPVFPSFHEQTTGQNENSSSSAKQQNYFELLRDIHLFLSTQSDVLSPPSRPCSPSFDHRVQEVRNNVRDAVGATEGRTSSGKWTCVSQTLRLGCVRGRHWSLSGDAPGTPMQDTNWILPDEESEWIEWEKKREETRRPKGNTIPSQGTPIPASIAPDSHPSAAESSQPLRVTRERPPPGVSPTVLRAAKEKVRKWQVSVASENWNSTASASTSTRAVATDSAAKGNRTLDFAVVKPATRPVIGKKDKDSLSRPSLRGDSAPIPLHRSKSSTPLIPEVEGADEAGSKETAQVSPLKDDMPKIADVSETPYLPPSFPTHLETSTPLPDSVKVVRAKPSPIPPLPASASAPQTSTSTNPLDEPQPHAATRSFCLPPISPQIDTEQAGKRSRVPTPPLDGIPNDPCVTPPAKKLRSELENRATPSSNHSKPISPNAGPDLDGRDPNVGPGLDVPLVSGKNDGTGSALQSPTKSIKSYFSVADSDQDDSPLKGNLLLESPVSPMLSYAQNASGFLPQVTSTQAERGSPSAGRGVVGIGYSSQFDVEKHVDRVSELLEKDVDFDGWLRDVRTVETSQD